MTQHLIRTLEQEGESAAAALAPQLGGMGEIARDLAYRLYTTLRTQEMGRGGPGIQWFGDRLAGTDEAGTGRAGQDEGHSTRDVLIEEENTMVYRGRVKNGVVVLDPQVSFLKAPRST